MSSQLDAAVDWGIAVIGLTVVAAAGRQVIARLFLPETPEGLELETQTIPYDKRTELEDKYGRWAVKTALAVCPYGDIKCVEREAQRLYESRELRRLKRVHPTSR